MQRSICPGTVLLHLFCGSSLTYSVSDGKEDIKEWMRGKNKTYSARDLITDEYCVAGYEADLVIYLGSINSLSTYMNKCRGQFVQVCGKYCLIIKIKK